MSSPAEYEPLLQEGEIEPFYVSEMQSKSVLSSIIIAIAMMVLALVFMGLFYWSYQKDKNLFIVVFSIIVLIYSSMITLLLVVMRSKMGFDSFRFFMGSSIFIDFLTILVIIYFGIKAFTRSLPSSVEDYLGKKF